MRTIPIPVADLYIVPDELDWALKADPSSADIEKIEFLDDHIGDWRLQMSLRCQIWPPYQACVAMPEAVAILYKMRFS